MDFRTIPERKSGVEQDGLLQGVEYRATISAQVDSLFDGTTTSKWFDKLGASPEHPSWVELKLKEGSIVPATHYALVSADDNPGYDPKDWTLLGLLSIDDTGVEYWMAVDEQKGVEFPKRKSRQEFEVLRPTPCVRYKLVITDTKEAGGPVQLACWELYCRPAAGQRYGSYAIPMEGGQPSQVQGGLCAGSFPCQTVFASKPNTTWVHPLLVSETRPAWIEYRLWSRQSPVIIERYSMLPDPDITHLDPYSWKLQGWPADDNKWLDLHCVDGEVFTDREEHSIFQLDREHTIPCIRWRLVITSSTEFEGPVMLRGFALMTHADIELTVSGDMQATSIQAADKSSKVRKRQLVRDLVAQAITKPSGKLPVLRGGFCFASGQHEEVGETADKVFDGSWDTKWLDPCARKEDGTVRSWVDYQLAPDQEPATLACYSIVSANDHPERDPREWQLLGLPAVYDSSERAVDRFVQDEGWASPTPSSTGQAQWVVLDIQRDVEWSKRLQEKRFLVSHSVPCTLFKLKFTRLREDTAHHLQLAEIYLMVNPKMEPLWAGGDPDFQLEDNLPASATNSTNSVGNIPAATEDTATSINVPSQVPSSSVNEGTPTTTAATATPATLTPTATPKATATPTAAATPTATGQAPSFFSNPFAVFQKAIEQQRAEQGTSVASTTTDSAGSDDADAFNTAGASVQSTGGMSHQSSGETAAPKKRWGFLRPLRSKEVAQQETPPEPPKAVQVKSADQIGQEYGSPPPAKSKSEGNAFDQLRHALQQRGEVLDKADLEAKQMEEEMAAFAAAADEYLEREKAKANSWWPL